MASKYQHIIDSNDIVIIFYEGLGSYSGTPIDKAYHPKGRMGARVSVYKKGEKVFSTNYASTLPDGIGVLHQKFNGGSPVPTTKEMLYDVYSTMHLSKYKALELGKWSESVPVIRGDNESSSSGINVHRRKSNDYSSFAWSTGCLTILDGEIERMIDCLDIGSFNGEYVGKLIVDRTNMDQELYSLYESYYPNMFSDFCTPEGLTSTEEWILDELEKESEKNLIEIVEEIEEVNISWQQKIGNNAIDSLVGKGLLDSLEEWKSKDMTTEKADLWFVLEMLNRITE